MAVATIVLLTSFACTPLTCLAFGGPVANTEAGKVQGSYRGGIPGPVHLMPTVDVFQGIPYAAAPLGANRFKPPQPFTEHWAPKTREAKKAGNICAQLLMYNKTYFGKEDCLYLNVYRPHGVGPGDKVPVIMYIHGGGFFSGDSQHIIGGALELYDATHIVEKHRMVFVSMNYRLNGFGFFALPELATESGTTGNYGLLDQRAAMEWVQRNIRYFGGDPAQVTIQGESAGGMSVAWHLVSPGSKDLFHSAIMESGTIDKGCFFQNKTDAMRFSRELAQLHGCTASGADLLACMRKLPAEDMMISAVQMVRDFAYRNDHRPLPADVPSWACPIFPLNPFGAVVDESNISLPDWPLKLLQSGRFHKVPLIIGDNLNEGAAFGWSLPLLFGELPYPLLTPENYTKVLEWFIPNKSQAAQAAQLYGGADFPTDIDRVDRFWTDSFFKCPAREIATQVSSHGVPVFQYVFSFDMRTNISSVFHALNDAHGFELPFVFDNWIGTLGLIFGEPLKYARMSKIMSCTWASFVTCSKPKCPKSPPNCDSILKEVPDWPQFSAPLNRHYISFKDHISVEAINAKAEFGQDEFPGDDRCDFWKTVDFGFRNIRNQPETFQVHSPSSEALLV